MAFYGNKVNNGMNASGIDFSASVINFATPAPMTNTQPYRGHLHSSFVQATGPLLPPTKDQQLRTLFVGHINKDLDDYWMERILKSVAKLKSWRRVLDAFEESSDCGFAEYEDSEHTYRAFNMLKDLEIVRAGEVDNKIKFLVVVDDVTLLHLEDVMENRENKNPGRDRGLIANATTNLNKVLADFGNPNFQRPDKEERPQKKSKKEKQDEGPKEDAKAVTIMLTADDELGDIPQELREQIAIEITSFRERSAIRDLERAKQIEEVERKKAEFERASRRAASDSGRAQLEQPEISRADAIRQELNLPPKSSKSRLTVEEERMSDEELVRKRQARKEDDIERQLKEQEARWRSKEATRIIALEREETRLSEEMRHQELEKEVIKAKLANWNDDAEAEKRVEEYYRDRLTWARHRGSNRAREIEMDKQDALAEEREKKARDEADSKNAIAPSPQITSTEDNEPAKSEQAMGAPVRLSLAKKIGETKRANVNAEHFMEEEEDSQPRRKLVPLQYEDKELAEEQRQARIRAIVDTIPSAKDELRRWPVKWERLDQATMMTTFESFASKKMVEAIGLVDDGLLSFIIEHIRNKRSVEELESEVEAAIGDEEASLFVAKIWRYLLILLETAEV